MKKRINVEVEEEIEIACRWAMLTWRREKTEGMPTKMGELVQEALTEYLKTHAPDSLEPRPGRPPAKR